MSTSGRSELPLVDALRMSAQSLVSFGQIFFPKTMRQKSPAFHEDISSKFVDRQLRYLLLECFRGSAKTALARIALAHRVGFALGHTGMLGGLSQAHSIRSLRWLKAQVEHNRAFREAFELEKGDKWTDEWITIVNRRFNAKYSIIALGITGTIRGLNIDDYRPDFILLDDPCDEENQHTDEQREKVTQAVFGGFIPSLAPKSESPLSQMAVLQTPINSQDLTHNLRRDGQFHCVRYGCFDEAGQSRWPERWTTEELLKMKQGYIQRNRLHTWLAEMECTITDGSLLAFKVDWLKYWDAYPDEVRTVISIDPASSDSDKADFTAISVLAIFRGRIFLLDYHQERGMMPDAVCHRLFDWVVLYQTRDVAVETVAYQRVLAWYIEKEATARRMYLNVHKVQDKRRKSDRITQALLAVAPYGNLLVRETHTDFITQFSLYGESYRGHDDLLDSVSIGITHLLGYAGRLEDTVAIEGEFKRLREQDKILAATANSDDDDEGTPSYMSAP